MDTKRNVKATTSNTRSDDGAFDPFAVTSETSSWDASPKWEVCATDEVPFFGNFGDDLPEIPPTHEKATKKSDSLSYTRYVNNNKSTPSERGIDLASRVTKAPIVKEVQREYRPERYAGVPIASEPRRWNNKSIPSERSADPVRVTKVPVVKEVHKESGPEKYAGVPVASEPRRWNNKSIPSERSVDPLRVTKVPVEREVHKESRPEKFAGVPVASESSRRFLVLCSGMSLKRECTTNQEMAYTILAGLNLPYDKIDGAEAENKDKRNELFQISGLRGQYPQFFVIENDTTTFFGDWDTFQYTHENGQLQNVLSASETMNDTSEQGNSLPEANERVLVLYSGMSNNRTNQERAFTILDGMGVVYDKIDGADAVNKDRRNELFDLSGLRGAYPQFFVIKDGISSFVGGWDAFQRAHDEGNLSGMFFGSPSSTLLTGAHINERSSEQIPNILRCGNERRPLAAADKESPRRGSAPFVPASYYGRSPEAVADNHHYLVSQQTHSSRGPPSPASKRLSVPASFAGKQPVDERSGVKTTEAWNVSSPGSPHRKASKLVIPATFGGGSAEKTMVTNSSPSLSKKLVIPESFHDSGSMNMDDSCLRTSETQLQRDTMWASPGRESTKLVIPAPFAPFGVASTATTANDKKDGSGKEQVRSHPLHNSASKSLDLQHHATDEFARPQSADARPKKLRIPQAFAKTTEPLRKFQGNARG
jgi:hypothetical protein